MTMHLIKLSVGSQAVDDLARWQQSVIRRNQGTALEGYTHHVTRMFPKRADELMDGGSIYWVIARQIQCRQRIVDVQEVKTSEGRKCCLVLDTELVRVNPVGRGPFQGWRYLKPDDAPVDLESGVSAEDLPIRAELAELGLL
ncbi:MAG: DUF1489 domain-containing protein [Parvularculaceae bacterium]|nr:DUF1489 domain-containing protein [Parvularculaceae bacterium]